MTTREQIVANANGAARASRRGAAPILTVDSDSETVARWLQWCDPNGCHTAALAAVEGLEPYDDESAWDALEDMIANA